MLFGRSKRFAADPGTSTTATATASKSTTSAAKKPSTATSATSFSSKSPEHETKERKGDEPMPDAPKPSKPTPRQTGPKTVPTKAPFLTDEDVVKLFSYDAFMATAAKEAKERATAADVEMKTTSGSSTSSSATSSSSTGFSATDLKLAPNTRFTVSTTAATSNADRYMQRDAKVPSGTLAKQFADLIQMVAGDARSAGIGKGWWNTKLSDLTIASLTAANFNQEYPSFLDPNGKIFVAAALDIINQAPDDAPAATFCHELTLLDVVRNPDIQKDFADLVVAEFNTATLQSTVARTPSTNASALKIQLTLLFTAKETTMNRFFESLVRKSDGSWGWS